MGIHWKDATSTMLRELVSAGRVGLVTDMDGTISPIVENPEDAMVTPRNYELLQKLQAKLPLVSIVSGRAVRSVTLRMSLPGVIYIGNHGLERCVNGEIKHNIDVSGYRPNLEDALGKLRQVELSGVRVEDKGVTVTLHYRQAAEPQSAHDALSPLVHELADQTGLEYFEGRMIFELRPPVHVNKGTAFQGLIEEFALDSAIYVGDDTTDISALQMAQQLRKEETCQAMGVGVVSDDSPPGLVAASDLLAIGISDVENLLAWLLQNTK